jgi:hypothetical protein
VLDVAAALAQLAVERDYVRPEIDASLDFIIEGRAASRWWSRRSARRRARSSPTIATSRRPPQQGRGRI